MKVEIIRCLQTEDYCPGTTDFKAIKNKSGVFAARMKEIVEKGVGGEVRLLDYTH